MGMAREAVKSLASVQAARFIGARGVQDLLQAAEFLFWVHPRDSLGDLGPVTSPRHCCLSICEIKVAVSVSQTLPERGRLMRQSLQSVCNSRR